MYNRIGVAGCPGDAYGLQATATGAQKHLNMFIICKWTAHFATDKQQTWPAGTCALLIKHRRCVKQVAAAVYTNCRCSVSGKDGADDVSSKRLFLGGEALIGCISAAKFHKTDWQVLNEAELPLSCLGCYVVVEWIRAGAEQLLFQNDFDNIAERLRREAGPFRRQRHSLITPLH